MSALLTISAKIYFLSPEEGGRKTPIFSGYRPALYFGEKQTDGAIMLPSGGRAVPGTECEVIINLLHPEHLGDAVKPMATFEAKEGSRVVGRGQVLCTHHAAAKA
jgi:elongation factor Tu